MQEVDLEIIFYKFVFPLYNYPIMDKIHVILKIN